MSFCASLATPAAHRLSSSPGATRRWTWPKFSACSHKCALPPRTAAVMWWWCSHRLVSASKWAGCQWRQVTKCAGAGGLAVPATEQQRCFNAVWSACARTALSVLRRCGFGAAFCMRHPNSPAHATFRNPQPPSPSHDGLGGCSWRICVEGFNLKRAATSHLSYSVPHAPSPHAPTPHALPAVPAAAARKAGDGEHLPRHAASLQAPRHAIRLPPGMLLENE